MPHLKTILLLIMPLISCISAARSKIHSTEDAGVARREGSRIAVVKKTADMRGAIEILDENGTSIATWAPLTRQWSPTWSDNGEYLAFLSDRDLSPEQRSEEAPASDPFYQAPGHLFVLYVTSGVEHKVTSGNAKAWMPKLSPAGTRVAFLSDAHSKGDLYESASIGSTISQLTKNKNWSLESALWLSESELLYNAFVDDTLDVFRLKINEKQVRKIELSAPKGSKSGYLSLSHDGKRLAFVTRDRVKDAQTNTINPQIFVADIDGANTQQLTFNDGVNYAPSWSSDDQSIAFLRQVESADGPRANLYVLNVHNKKESLVATTVTSTPQWLPNKALVYSSFLDGRYRLFIYDLDTATPKQIGDPAADYFEPATIGR